MKIGILTLPFNNNYGGYLQAYALITVLKEMGYEVELIYRRNDRRRKLSLLWSIIKNCIKIAIGKKVVSFKGKPEVEYRYRGGKMLTFVDKYIEPKTKPFYSSDEMYQYISRELDMIIIGSDQVWRPDYGQKHVQDFFLTELPSQGPKRISYAASFGLDFPCYTEKEIKECGKAIFNFDAISVREIRGVDIIREFGWKVKADPIVVLDPTFLLPKEHYSSLLLESSSVTKGKIFSYVLDLNNDTNSIVEELSKQTGLEVYNIIDTERWLRKDYIMPSLEDWLVGIRDADFVVTDSYHGTVFSIIFNKPFITKQNSSLGSTRFESILKRIGLEGRLIQNSAQVKSALSEDIDWNQVTNILTKEILTSKHHLECALNY